jgi:hypothetical protein
MVEKKKTRKRCPTGQRKDPKTGKCKGTKKKRCPVGQHRDKKSGKCKDKDILAKKEKEAKGKLAEKEKAKKKAEKEKAKKKAEKEAKVKKTKKVKKVKKTKKIKDKKVKKVKKKLKLQQEVDKQVVLDEKRASQIEREFEAYMKERERKRAVKKTTSKKGKEKKGKAKKTTKKKSKVKEILKVRKEYIDLGIKEDSWFSDPCYVLTNIKRKLNVKTWTPSILKKLNKTIPIMTRSTGTSPEFMYGNQKVVLGYEIGSGSFGTIYKATMTDTLTGYKKNIVLKSIVTRDPEEFLRESIIHMELFCGLRGQWGNGARIPKLEFISKYASARGKDGWKYIVGMEQLDGDGWDFLSNHGKNNKKLCPAIKSLSILLSKLQDKFEFMHRDFHLGNIMYKKLPNNEIRMYIIDFGLSTMKINNKWLNRITKTYHYEKTYDFNPSHDLRMLLTTIYYRKYNITKSFLTYLIQVERSILRYREIDEYNLWWDTYKNLMPYYDSDFIPKTVGTYMDKLYKGEKIGILPPSTIKVLKHGKKLPKKPYSKGPLYDELKDDYKANKMVYDVNP